MIIITIKTTKQNVNHWFERLAMYACLREVQGLDRIAAAAAADARKDMDRARLSLS